MLFLDEYEYASKALKLGAVEESPGGNNITSASTQREIANAAIAKHTAEDKVLYTCGQKFMTCARKGDAETFYLHTLYSYMPTFLRLAYDRHRLGVGVFSMEAF